MRSGRAGRLDSDLSQYHLLADLLVQQEVGDACALEVVRRIGDVIAARRLRVTILTGDDFSMDVIKAMSLGAFEYWIKPVDPRVLEASVRRALNGRHADPVRTLRQD